jgi:hypothetical protein
VLTQTVSKIETLGLNAAVLPNWYDIDTWDNLLRLKEELGNLPLEILPNTRRFFSKHNLSDHGS